MTRKKVMQTLKGTTFQDLFDLPTETDPSRINPLNDEEFNENVVPIAKGVLYDILMDPKEKAYSRIEAARELLNRSLGKPIMKNFNAEIDAESMADILPKVVQRKPKEEPPVDQ